MCVGYFAKAVFLLWLLGADCYAFLRFWCRRSPALKDCVVSKVDYRYPQRMIFLSISDHKEELVIKLREQNKVVRHYAEGDFQKFANELIRIRCWPGRARGTFK